MHTTNDDGTQINLRFPNFPKRVLPKGFVAGRKTSLTPAQEKQIEFLERVETNATDVREVMDYIAIKLDEVKKTGKLVTVQINLNPIWAQALLAINEPEPDDRNRALRNAHLRRLCRDIREKRWELTGQAVIISIEGSLNDGQHRCEAVLETGIAITTLLTLGPTRVSRMKLDLGTPRRAGDFITQGGFSHGNMMGATARLLMAWEAGYALSGGGSLIRDTNNAEVADYFFNHYEEMEGMHEALGSGTFNSNKILTGAYTLFIAIVLGRVLKKEAIEFVKLLIHGGAEQDSPINIVRNRLMDLDSDSTRHPVRTELIVRAWNAWRKGEKGSRLKVRNEIPKIYS